MVRYWHGEKIHFWQSERTKEKLHLKQDYFFSERLWSFYLRQFPCDISMTTLCHNVVGTIENLLFTLLMPEHSFEITHLLCLASCYNRERSFGRSKYMSLYSLLIVLFIPSQSLYRPHPSFWNKLNFLLWSMRFIKVSENSF